MDELNLSRKSFLALSRLEDHSETSSLKLFSQQPQLSTSTAAEILSLSSENSLIIKLQYYLLKDLNRTFNISFQQPKQKKTHKKWKKFLHYLAFAIGGIIFTGCEGFDAIATMLQLVNIPVAAVLAISSAIALVAVFVFYRYEMGHISSGLSSNRKTAVNTINLLHKQLAQMKQICKKIKDKIPLIKSSTEAGQVDMLLKSINKRKIHIHHLTSIILKQRNSLGLKMVRTIISGFEGFIFFCGGFCIGQTTAYTLASLIAGPSISLLSPYILIPCMVIGLVSLGFFLVSEKDSLLKLIDKSLGFDMKNIKKMMHSTQDIQGSLTNNIQNNQDALENRVKQIENDQCLKQTIQYLFEENSELRLTRPNTAFQAHRFFLKRPENNERSEPEDNNTEIKSLADRP